MDTILMNSGNSKHLILINSLFNLSDKGNLKKGTKMLLYKILGYTIHGKI